MDAIIHALECAQGGYVPYPVAIGLLAGVLYWAARKVSIALAGPIPTEPLPR